MAALYGRYIQRTDGALLFESGDPGTGQPPILDASTALPLAHIVAAADGYAHGCAALDDGSVECWRTNAGGNSSGQLGSGATDTSGPLYRATPVLAAAGQPLSNVVALATGSAQSSAVNTCAITADGKLFCWGDVSWLVNGGKTLASPYAIPVTQEGVTPFSGVVQADIAADGTYCAVVHGASKNDVYCWGVNEDGQLATGDTTARDYPTKVLGLTAPKKVVTVGWGQSVCALDGDNVRCWGDNAVGITGPSATSGTVTVPTLVTLMGGQTALAGLVDLAAGTTGYQQIGANAFCALASDKTVKCWGYRYQTYPTNYGVIGVVALGDMLNAIPDLLTTDGLYHIGMTSSQPNCDSIQ